MAGARLLLVEPDTAIADLFALVLTEAGYTLECASSPQKALALLAGRGPNAFDMVLSTPFAPPRAPYAWLARLRARTCAPIVLCTRDAVARYAEYRAHGCAAVIEEPCDLQEVLDVVAGLLT